MKYVIKRALNWWRTRKQTEEDKEEEIYTRYEQDFDLPPEGQFGLFSEYLELSKLYIPQVAFPHIMQYKLNGMKQCWIIEVLYLLLKPVFGTIEAIFSKERQLMFITFYL